MAALAAELAPAHVPAPGGAPQRSSRPDLRVAPRPRRSGRYIALMLALSALGVFGCVALNALAAEQSFAVRELERDVAELTQTVDELTVDVTRLRSPARIRRAATKGLGMVPAEQPAYVILPGRGGTSGKSSRPTRTITASVSGG
ncbi:MAG: hypothetical protein GEU74_12505 [Nitriliruptorales bacterium]|nr:hypothetical protein [Nitriliruptorales bacterium]